MRSRTRWGVVVGAAAAAVAVVVIGVVLLRRDDDSSSVVAARSAEDAQAVVRLYDASAYANELYWPPGPPALRVIERTEDDPDRPVSGAGIFGSAGYTGPYPRTIDQRRERLEGLAYAGDVRFDGHAQVWTDQILFVAPRAQQSEFATILAALRSPAGAAVPTVVAGESAPTTNPAVQDAEHKLAKVIPEVRLEDVTLQAAFEQLGDAARANIVVEWGELDGLGVERTTPIRLRVWGLPLSRVFDALLESIGRRAADYVAYRAEAGLIRVTTTERLSQTGTTLRIYDVRRLAERIIASDHDMGVRVAAQLHVTANPPAKHADDYAEMVMYELSSFVIEHVDPDTWRENGGNVGSVRAWGGRLIIYQSPENHREIEKVLKTLTDAITDE